MLTPASVKSVLVEGGVIAYPTEAVYGLGCDPLNEAAVKKILQLKRRDVKKGLILIAASFEQIQPFIQMPDPEKMREILQTWPGPVTWVFPVSPHTPAWISGSHSSVAVRVTAHPIAKKICEDFGGALVSTSANVETQPPARSHEEVRQLFGDRLDLIIPGSVGGRENPSEIRDALSGKVLRPG